MNTASKALLIVLLFAAPAFAQNVRVDNVTFSSVQGFPFLPGATITVCTAAATGLPCSPTVSGTCLSISDVTCNQSATLTSDALGNYGFWIQPGSYSYTVTKAGFGGFGPKPLTLACTPVASCTITGALTVNSPGSITAGAGAPTSLTNLTVSGTGTFSGNNTITAGKINGVCAVDGVQNTTLAAAVTCAGTNGTVLITPGFNVPTLTAGVTIPNSVILRADGWVNPIPLGNFNITFGNTASIQAPNVQLFNYTGSGVVSNLSGEVSPAWFSGVDLGAQTNNALTACSPASSTGCVVRISGGALTNAHTYTFSTQINYPVFSSGNIRLKCDEGILLSYTGSGYFVEAKPTVATNADNIRISGCHVQGTSAGAGGVHLVAANAIHLSDLDITGFTGQNAAGIVNDGSSNVTIDGFSNIRGNSVGMKSSCITASFGGTFCAAGDRSLGNHYQANTGPGVWEAPGTQFGVNGGDAGNLYEDVIEGNGGNSASPITLATATATGACASSVCTITVASTSAVTMGMVTVTSAFNSSTCYNGRFTIETVVSPTTYSYHCIGGAATATGGTIVAHVPQVNLQQGLAITVRAGFMQLGSSSTNELACINIGGSSEAPNDTVIESSMFSCVGAVSTIDQFQGAGTVIQGNTELNTVTNFFNPQFAGHTYLGKNWSNATNYATGASSNYDFQLSNAVSAAISAQFNSAVQFVEGATPSAFGTLDICNGSSSLHMLQCNYNGGSSFFPIPQTANASGTHSDSGFYQTATAAGCTTAASIGGICATPITITWITAFADTNYKVICTPNGAATNLPSSPYLVTPSTGSATINYFAISAAAASWPNVTCMAVHN